MSFLAKLNATMKLAVQIEHAKQRARYSFVTSVERVEGRPVFVDDDLVLIHTQTLPSKPAAFIYGTSKEIFLNKKANELPKPVRDSIVYHEVGHDLNGDLDNLPKNIFVRIWNLFRPDITQEFKADAYAASKTSKEAVLQMLDAIFPEKGDAYEQRVKALKESNYEPAT